MLINIKKLIKSFFIFSINFIKSQIYTFKYFSKPLPIYTKIEKKGLKVHLGSGPINLQGWINIDVRNYSHTHLFQKDFHLKQFTPGSIEEIYMSHVLEHFSFIEAENLLIQLHEKLDHRGLIRISVPSFDSMVRIYLDNKKDLSSISGPLFGGQDYEYNFHKSVYNKNSLTALLKKCGFKNIVEWNTWEDFGVNLGDWSNAKIKTKITKRSISLNLKGRK